MPRAAPLLPACLLACLLAGCATGGEFPSLAPRPVEQLSFEEPIKVDPPVAADPTLSARAGALVAEARAGDRQFEQAYARALPLVRAAGPAGADAWIQAQEAISRVEAARIGTTSALSDLDLLIAEQSDDPTNESVWADLQAARQAAEALVADQRRRLEGLKGSVSSF
jgi:hypothetical protein